MFDKLLAFLKSLSFGGKKSQFNAFSKDDPRLAMAALMFHIINSGGEWRKEKCKRLSDALSQAYQLKGDALKKLVKAAEMADQEAIDLYSFTSVIKRHLDEPARVHFIELMWEMVYADGQVHELEDNLMWRVAELIGVSSHNRLEMKRTVAARFVVEEARS